MNTVGLVDIRNRDLWNTLIEVHEIEIKKQNREDYLAFSKSEKTIIYVPLDNIDLASFTHELLHIYLRIKEVFIGGGLIRMIKENQVLSKIFSDNLLDHIGNCLDHIKMLPEFLRLGFSPEEFLTDYSDNKLSDSDVSQIKKQFVTKGLFKKTYISSGVDLYIGKYFAANACPNKSIDYSFQLKELRKIDEKLFLVLENFLDAWIRFDYNDEDPVSGSYNFLLFDFINDLEKWTIGKNIK